MEICLSLSLFFLMIILVKKGLSSNAHQYQFHSQNISLSSEETVHELEISSNSSSTAVKFWYKYSNLTKAAKLNVTTKPPYGVMASIKPVMLYPQENFSEPLVVISLIQHGVKRYTFPYLSHEGTLELEIRINGSKDDFLDNEERQIQEILVAEIVFVSYLNCENRDLDDMKLIRCWMQCRSMCIVRELSYQVNCSIEEEFEVRRRCQEQLMNTDSVSEQSSENVKFKYEEISHYFIPTAAFLFIIWGIFSVLKKCFRFFKYEFQKEDHYSSS